LAMAYEGSRGQTAEEIRTVFHFPLNHSVLRSSFATEYNQLNNVNASYKLHTANALWIQQDFPILKDYTDTIREYYGGKAAPVDFAGATEQARQNINSWVEEKTSNKIKDLLPVGSVNGFTRLVITNAIYFKGKWVKQFDKQETKEENFNTVNGQSVKVQMMKLTGENATFNYTETGDLQILEMPYEGGNLSMLVLLPRSNSLQSVEESLTAGKLSEWKGQLAQQRVDVFMPKFSFTKQYSLNDNLGELGMPTAFTAAADFSGIASGIFIKGVVHKAFVDVNEEGTEAAAATAVIFGATSVAPPVPVFRADHPFIFIIQQRENGNILFLGRVVRP